MTFNSKHFKNDRRFTSLNDSVLTRLVMAIPTLGRIMPKVEQQSRLVKLSDDALKVGASINGHSASILMEKSLGLESNTISRTYKWPGQFSNLDPIDLDKAISSFTNGAMDYARVMQGDTFEMTPSRIELAHTEGLQAYTRVCALNDIIVQLNPELKAARESVIKAKYQPDGFKAEIHLLAGAKFRKHPDDIQYFIEDMSHQISRDMSEHQRKLCTSLLSKTAKFTPPDVGIGWVMSPSIAKRVAEKLVELAKQGVEPKPRLYWAKQSVLLDQNVGFVNKLKHLVGLKTQSSSVQPNTLDDLQPGYNAKKVNGPDITVPMNQIDKELLHVSELLGVDVKSLRVSVRETRIEAPSINANESNYDTFSV